MQNYTGRGFLCIGDSHRFIDPIFAYGVYFGIQEGEFATEAIARYLSGEVKSNGNPFADFERPAAYSHFFAGQFIQQNGGSDASFVAVWSTFRF